MPTGTRNDTASSRTDRSSRPIHSSGVETEADNELEVDFAPYAYEEALKTARGLNEQLLEDWKAAGNSLLHVYEKALNSMLEFEERSTDTGQFGWLSSITQMHASFVREVTTAQMKAARELLS
jgi:hypothetical protein